jgi:hypothetical protein
MKKLIETSGKNPFKVPENYFDEVNRKIILAASLHHSEAKTVSLYSKVKPYLAIAAFLSGFILLSYTALQWFRSGDSDNRVPQISMQEFSELYLNEIDIITLEDNSAAVILSDEAHDIRSTDIIDYLLLENIDINEIYEQL